MIITCNSIDYEFIEAPIHITQQNIRNVFAHKNNKTVRETLHHHKYSRHEDLISKAYPDRMDMRIGDFLKYLKENKDSNYLSFLNKYGDRDYCKFELTTKLDSKGLYCFFLEDKVKYIGRCTDNFKTRVNNGYGTIHPKNCFKDGQATNCRINSLVNKHNSIRFAVYPMNSANKDGIKELEKSILNCGAASDYFEWNVQKQ